MSEKELTYGETIKQPFPKLEDVEKKIYELVNSNFVSQCEGCYKDKTFTVIVDDEIFRSTSTQWADSFNAVIKQIEGWQLKQTGPHAEIKAKYEKAIAEGKIVKVFCRDYSNDEWAEVGSIWTSTHHELRYYNIDWNKLLSWSYANGEFVECEFSNTAFKDISNSKLVGMSTSAYRFVTDFRAGYRYCRLAKGVKTKDEWLKEIK